ncbi:hypothetical protein jhhlp_003041 [Lomentospora prolificans]|uniref:Stress-response A/B barrel domain-containing protein n=1 Tax=Lomentospora prolificans TaxID=41688 RepID=A0A2N3NFQ6_9PEZI|nr:hypothetical protein jhhlp_003041 [Lomentospora prolificans]
MTNRRLNNSCTTSILCFQITKMTVTHIVLLSFKASISQEDVKAACARFVGLKDACVDPKSGSPYILSLKGGKDNSPEGLQNGLSHGFVVEFASAADRDYYVSNDPAHQSFVKSIDGVVDKLTVLDFENGEF